MYFNMLGWLTAVAVTAGRKPCENWALGEVISGRLTAVVLGPYCTRPYIAV